ncbi:MAG: toll/interleukin-1 receptor domain-containing protein [Alphaproteobacteria bacterium]
MATVAEKPQVYVSYSHRDEEAKDFVGRHLTVLQTAGHVEVWDDRKITVGDDWYQAIEAKLEGCAVAVLLISTDFLGSEFCIKEEVSRLLERRKRDGMMIAPILLRPCAWKIFPWLAALQMQPRDDMPLLQLDQLQQERELTEIVLAIHAFLKEQAELVAAAIERAKATGQRTEIRGDNNTVVQVDGDHVHVNIVAGPKAGTPYPALAEGAVDLTRLPTSGFEVVGRDKELKFLDDAFDGNTLNVVSLRAWGGVGKSTLANKWCEYLAADNYRGARRTFAWSFYSQGTNERVTSADAFIDEALRFFGDNDPTAGSPWAKGERLAGLVGAEKTLLILDGMEPLQDEHQGIKDPALARLVECLAEQNAGLCVITTREPVKEFSDFPETTREIDLEHLSKEAGRALLRIKGLRAADDLLEQASEAFGNHALALNLLASYLKCFAGGDVSQALSLPDLPDVSVDDGKHPRRVMAAFAEQFGEGPELDLLYVVGLFDRPADAGCVATLRWKPAIPNLTERLSALEALDWRELLKKLRSLCLLAEESHHAPDELDAHPLVREHFGEHLRERQEKAWKSGHMRLYDHLVTMPKKSQPNTLAEMAPLFQAVHHACQAGRQQSAYEDVYQPRICHNNKLYLTRKLGAFSENLGLIGAFCETLWERFSRNLDINAQVWLLNEAAYNLRALGRLDEAVGPMWASMQIDLERNEWEGAAISASGLAELYRALGDLRARFKRS